MRARQVPRGDGRLSHDLDPQRPGPQDACGVFGVWAPGEEVANLTYFGLYALQHRGQEAAGIAVSDGSGVVVIMVSQSDANAVANQDCAVPVGKPPTQSIAIVWDDTWPFAPARTYPADFRDAGGSVITPSAPIGVATTFRMRFTLTGTTLNPDDAMSYATIALPPCFDSISVTSTTAAGNGKPMSDVRGDGAPIERLELVANRYPLIELAQVRRA